MLFYHDIVSIDIFLSIINQFFILLVINDKEISKNYLDI